MMEFTIPVTKSIIRAVELEFSYSYTGENSPEPVMLSDDLYANMSVCRIMPDGTRIAKLYWIFRIDSTAHILRRWRRFKKLHEAMEAKYLDNLISRIKE